MQILIVTPEATRWTTFGEGLRAAGLSCSFAGAPDDLKAESLKADRPLLVLWDEPYTGDALRAAPDIAAHGIVPHLVARAGRSPRPLGVDHELVGERVLVQPRDCAEQRCPLGARVHSPPQRLIRERGNAGEFVWRSQASFLCIIKSGPKAASYNIHIT